MKAVLCFVVIVGTAVLASGKSVSAPKSNWLADSVTRNGDVVHMDGNVRIAACGVITADPRSGSPTAVSRPPPRVPARPKSSPFRRASFRLAHGRLPRAAPRSGSPTGVYGSRTAENRRNHEE